MTLNIKDIFKEEIEQKRRAFLLSDAIRYDHLKPSPTPWIIYSSNAIPEHYTREKIILKENHALDIIHKDEDFDHFIWKTSAENIKQAMFDGLVDFDAQTSKIISRLGKYISLSHRRTYNFGTISDKYNEKLFLLRLTQERVAALQPLERLINSQDYSSSFDETIELIVTVLAEYQSKLESLKDEITSTDCDICRYDKDAKKNLQRFIDEDIKRLLTLKEQCRNHQHTDAKRFLSTFLKPYGDQSIGCFIKEQSIRHIRQAQHINQNLCYSRHAKSLMRGDFNSVCEDALIAIDRHKPDLHNPILREHQGLFDKGQYAVDFSYLENDKEGINHTLMGITQIEGFDKINYGDKPSIINETGSSTPLIKTRFTKWLINQSWQYNVRRVFYWILNIATGIVVGFTYDLFAGLIAFLSGQKLASGAKKLHISPKRIATEQTKYQSLITRVNAKTYSLGTLVGIRLRNFCINVFWDLTNGAKITVNQITFKFWESLKADYYLGREHKPSAEKTLNKLTLELNKLIEQRAQLKQQLEEQIPTFASLPSFNATAMYPEPAYHLNPGEWMDITNSAVNAARVVCETFTDNIHAKHSTAGLIFTASYIAGVGSILLPKLFAFLPKKYIAFSNAIGETMSKGTMAKAIGSGMTQAQLFTAVFEGMTNGHDSWLAHGSRMFEKSPADIITYITIAVGLGYIIAFELEIPGLSETIRDDLGTIPIPSLGFAGAKICILLVDFFKEKKERPTSDKLPDIKQQLEDLIEALLTNEFKVATHKVEGYKKKLINRLLNDELLNGIDTAVTDSNYELNPNDSIHYLQKIRLLHRLESNKSLLPHLPVTLKGEILETINTLFPGDADTKQTIYELLNPPPPQSIFVVTLTTIVDYIPLSIRCLASCITRSSKPFSEMKYKLRKDLTRVLNATSNALYGVATFFRAVSRNICDIVANEIIARTDSYINGDTHQAASSTYKMTEAFDAGFEHNHQRLNKQIDNLKRQSTHSVAHSIFSKHTYKIFNNNKSIVNNEVAELITASDRMTSSL